MTPAIGHHVARALPWRATTHPSNGSAATRRREEAEPAMPWYEAFALMIGAVLVLMGLGLPVAFAFIAANVMGAFVFLGGERGIAQLVNNGSSALTNFALVPVPLFLLMGELFFHTGLATSRRGCSMPSTS
jgi:Tripartite ATP-independent periplasmic transporter, DctM component